MAHPDSFIYFIPKHLQVFTLSKATLSCRYPYPTTAEEKYLVMFIRIMHHSFSGVCVKRSISTSCISKCSITILVRNGAINQWHVLVVASLWSSYIPYGLLIKFNHATWCMKVIDNRLWQYAAENWGINDVHWRVPGGYAETSDIYVLSPNVITTQ